MPYFSYMAKRNQGTMIVSMIIEAKLVGIMFLSKKNTGKPVAAAAEKHTACRLVKPITNLVLIADKSFGIGTYACEVI